MQVVNRMQILAVVGLRSVYTYWLPAGTSVPQVAHIPPSHLQASRCVSNPSDPLVLLISLTPSSAISQRKFSAFKNSEPIGPPGLIQDIVPICGQLCHVT